MQLLCLLWLAKDAAAQATPVQPLPQVAQAPSPAAQAPSAAGQAPPPCQAQPPAGQAQPPAGKAAPPAGQAPVIEHIIPSIAKVGSSQQPITIIGTNFPSSPTVSFNGAPVPSANMTCAESTQIVVTLPASDVATAGTFPITVYGGTSVSNDKRFTVSETGIQGVNLVLGFGALVVRGGSTNYQVNSTSNVLEGTSIGNATPQALAGVSFRLPIPGFSVDNHHSREDPWDAFVSLKFAPNSTEVLNGFVFGISYRVASHLSILAGYAFTPFSEPAPGFRIAAINAVEANPSAYPGYSVATLQANGASAFDGFPLIKQPVPQGTSATTANLYAGDPLETQYKSGLVVGISVPISLGSFFGYK